MKILKNGYEKEKTDVVNFKCSKCNCEFECEKDEYWEDNMVCLTSYPAKHNVYANCPCCHKICISYKTVEYKSLDVKLDDYIVKTNKHVKTDPFKELACGGIVINGEEV